MGRIYENIGEALNEIERDIMEMGILVHPYSMQNKIVKDDDNYKTLELQNYSFSILDLSHKPIPQLEWCKAEFDERINKTSTFVGEAWKLRPDIWKEFINDDNTFDYTYGERINCYDQLNKVIEELKINPDSRQCLIQIHQPKDVDSFRKKRIPCSLSYQFLIRRNQLDIIYNMRSSDFDTHFSNDIWLADELRNYIANKINIRAGMLHMNIGSLHRYKNYTNKHVF